MGFFGELLKRLSEGDKRDLLERLTPEKFAALIVNTRMLCFVLELLPEELKASLLRLYSDSHIINFVTYNYQSEQTLKLILDCKRVAVVSSLTYPPFYDWLQDQRQDQAFWLTEGIAEKASIACRFYGELNRY